MDLGIRKSTQNFLRIALIFFLLLLFAQCSDPAVTILPMSDKDNGGLFLPGGFEAVVVVDSIGETRHIAVNENGDVYAQLQSSDDGKGTIAMRDLDNDGKVDSIVHFGDYVDKGRGATGLTIHNGYLYTSSKKHIFRSKLAKGELVPTSETEIVLTDMDPNVGRNWHTTKPVAFDEKGNMYVPFGSPLIRLV